MGTTSYFDRPVADFANEESKVSIEVGTTGFGGEGPQMYLNVGGESVLLSHEDAKELIEAFDSVATYLGYRKR